ncbi:S-adenosylmethionine carrier 1, chloroplastic/mitochondrial [Gracilariopsis chorda]|uniref:S-adenosylmethionine carrier 1, chloroplastic/mitochondrial n=1 Tax=Gracilariopsis chorda TaxID=448386 RepID=A0A2V3IRS7_9FLOR|nr:S-adenosylmethionine carrier 1, chloroplastic/mitochondrial [Gracilariopsis chorda]|eukprot:PXF44814.1 S-adenosylmethionine carrier 1, chloroplastic/mitochondrial [Gracilariopsis chorda]
MGREPPVSSGPGSEKWTIIADLLAGGLAGVCCDMILHPVDTVKSRLHVQRGPPFKYRSMLHGFRLITQQEGVRKGLYAGFGAVIAGTIPTHAVMFAGYKAIKRRGEDGIMDEQKLAAIDFTSASFGEICALPFYVPAEVIAKRMQVARLGPARNYKSTAHAARSIMKSEGFRGLLSGFWPTMLRDVPYTALQFSFFSFGKDHYRSHIGKHELNDVEATVLGFVVGAIAAILTNPFDVIKTRFMTQSTGSERKYHSILQCFRRLVREEGPSVLMRGVAARVLWVGPGSGITLAVYERSSKLLRATWRLEEQSADSPT